MGTVIAQSMIDKASILLLDVAKVRWTQAELLGWLNDGQRDIATHRADACVKTEAMTLAASTIKQAIPASGKQFVRLTRNLGADGTRSGRAITECDRATLDLFSPTWPRDSFGPEVIHYMPDPVDPKAFVVYPKAPAGQLQVEIEYTYIPADIAAGAAITISDSFANALLDYVLYRAHSKDSEYVVAGLASGYYQAYAAALGITKPAPQ